jgi:NADPH2:quinone reductase
MKAIRVHTFGAPDVLRLENIPDPQPGAGEVLVRIRAAGVNPVDAYIRTGTYARKPSLPYTPGSDGAGDVAAVGAGVTSVKRGDRVYIAGFGAAAAGAGTCAELAICSPAQLYTLPARASYAQGAAMGVPYATAYRALFQLGAGRPGETVLVHGATGGVGSAAVELAHARGLRVIGSGGSDQGLALVRERGADVAVDHRTPGYADEIARATDGRGVDLVVEMAAHVNLDRDLALIAKHGRIVIVGSRGPVEINPRGVMSKDATVTGFTLFNATDRDIAEIHAALIAGLANGTLNPAIGREMPLADAARAHAAIMEPGALGKIVLTV